MGASTLALIGRVVPSVPRRRVERVADRLREAIRQMGADAGFLGTPSSGGRAVHVLRVTPQSTNFVELGFPIDAPYPLAASMRFGVPLFIADNAHLACDHPGLVRMRAADHACATVPLLDERTGTLLGAINLTFEDPREFSDAERSELEALARACATDLRAD